MHPEGDIVMIKVHSCQSAIHMAMMTQMKHHKSRTRGVA